MKDKICVFAGTTEGRRITEILCGAADLTVCVATEYGEIMLDGIKGINVHTGRMDKAGMTDFFKENSFDLIIDATHPYAVAATDNIIAAADSCGVDVMRISRRTEAHETKAVYVSSAEEARDYLSERDGNIFLTTGSKELSKYSGLDMQRVWARVLPSHSSIDLCEKAGVLTSHIIAAQGPFTYEINLAQLKTINAEYLVTKASGTSGGYEEKIKAALDFGAVPIIIGEPPQVRGFTLDEAIKELEKRYAVKKRKISIIGIGPGNECLLTAEAKNALNECDALIGAESVVSSLLLRKPVFYEFLPEKTAKILDGNPSLRNIAVVMRGDTGFFSGAKKMLECFANEDVRVFPGISSVSAFAAKLGVSWDGAALVSMHGRYHNIVHTVETNKKTFVLAGGEYTVDVILNKLCFYGLSDVRVAVGEKLTYADETVTRGTAEELKNSTFDALSVVYIENELAENRIRIGIDDDEFIRGDVPMTKSEVRAVSLSQLGLSSDSVVWDIGAGTGSVSAECALCAYDGKVFAIEKESDAAELIEKNKIKFRADNIKIVRGEAPEVLSSLPDPTHVFIGGSGGRLEDTVAAILQKNSDAKIVVNTVTLESQNEAYNCAKKCSFRIFRCIEVNISRSQKIGRYNMMRAHNPVCVFVMQGGKIGD
ncbi:MAG: precorrin-6A reductase [Clostridia bacterium]|nr:precorrin-6A reductase [Clostridia bacterium]